MITSVWTATRLISLSVHWTCNINSSWTTNKFKSWNSADSRPKYPPSRAEN